MCVCVRARARETIPTEAAPKRSIALTAMGIFFSSERLVVAPENKNLKMERERETAAAEKVACNML